MMVRSKCSRRLAAARRSDCCCHARSSSRGTNRMRIVPVTAIPAASPRSAGATFARRACISLAAALSAAVMLTGCATTKAATVIDAPPLAVPRAPERVLVPAEQEPLSATAVGPDTPVASVPRVQQQQPPPSPARPRTARTDGDARSDAAAQPPSSAATQPPGNPSDANRQLRVVPSSAEMAADQQNVQNLLKQVDADLKKVDPSKLSSNGAANFQESKRFSLQAAEKLKEGNVNLALVAAQKAAELAATLANR